MPKVYSEYVAVVPATFDYHTNLKGFYPLTEQKNSVLRQYFLLNGVRQDCSRMTYIMRDIPAFKEEAFMLAPINYISSINYELAKYYSPEGRHVNFAQEWNDIDRELLAHSDFGGQLKDIRAFQEILPAILQGTNDDLAKAKAVYKYIQSNINWNGYLGQYTEQGVRKTLQNRKGNIGDINLALIAGLNAAGVDAYPVIISTRQNGTPGLLNPVLTDFNAVICLTKIAGEDYLLDASEKRLPFGQLSIRSVNDRGRVIYSKKHSDWVPLENKVPAKTIYNIVAKITKEGTLTGTITGIYSGLNALHKRDEIDEYPSFEEYEDNLMEKTSAIRILNSKIENLNDLDQSFIEKLNFELDLHQGFSDDRILLNPIIYDRLSSNPFTLQTRNFHVDLGARQSEVSNITISIPEGYDLVHQPKNAGLSLPDGVAGYSYQSTFENQLLILQQRLSLNQAVYSPEEYFHLKELFARIIQQQLEDFQFHRVEI
ncbi:MAG: transglutaminase-like domain-containing protein [Sphingobacterium sp.]